VCLLDNENTERAKTGGEKRPKKENFFSRKTNPATKVNSRLHIYCTRDIPAPPAEKRTIPRHHSRQTGTIKWQILKISKRDEAK
jgi:hypothetical protein